MKQSISKGVIMFSKVRLFLVATAVFATTALTGCASTVSIDDFYKKSDSKTTKIIEGEVLDYKLLTKRELTLMDSAITGTSAANIGNAPVQGALLAVDVASSLSNKGNMPFYIKIKENSTGEVSEFISKIYLSKDPAKFEVGNQAVLIFRSPIDFMSFNITKFPDTTKYIQ